MSETNQPVTVSESPRKLPNVVIAVAFLVLIAFLAFLAFGLRRSMMGPITVGQSVPNFSLTTFDGQTIHTSELKGKVIVLNFWSSWCKPCEQEAADLERAWKRYQPGGEIVFLGLAYVDTEPNSLAYLKKFGITYPNGPDLATKVSQMFRIRGVPETYIIGKDGKLAYVKIGPFTSINEIVAAIESSARK
jgi:cytochrome c biogenesis protein CcmG/thiol:disulfide interchange protein DsbE